MEWLWGLGGAVAGMLVPIVILWRTNVASAAERAALVKSRESTEAELKQNKLDMDTIRASRDQANRALLLQKDDLARTSRALQTAQVLYNTLAERLVASKDPKIVTKLINDQLRDLEKIGKVPKPTPAD